ncbi:MAG TPA: molybdopterin oxidoreductase family protein [Egibacteraceae bacterium]|nr:molybdopterin oxidoreductase family protein [Egibacteraceae bacterium]
MEKETTTHCPYCSLNCGLKLVTRGQTVTGYAKWRQSPFSSGGLCAKGVTAWQQVHHPERLRLPRVRRGDRFVEVGWDEALDVAATGFLRIRERRGDAANAVLTGASLTNEKAYLVGKFARLALRTPHVDPNGRLCMSSAGAAAVRAFGLDRAMTPLTDVADADAVVVIGANLPDAYPLFMPHLQRARRRGARVAVVDPRGGTLVRDGDLHLALRPGTDAALATGLLRELDVLGLVDDAFVADRTVGYGEARRAAEPWTLARTAAVTGVPAAGISALARLLGRSERALLLHARGCEQQVTGTANVLAWINLALAAGHAGRRGSGIVTLTGQRNGQGAREHGQRCDQLPGYRTIDDPADRAVVAARWGVHPGELPGRGLTYVEILAAARRGEVAGALVLSTNPAVSGPRSGAVRAALDALEHLVVVDPFFSETCRHATVVLPGSTFAEDEGTITTTDGRVVRVDQAVPPQAVRGDLDVLRGLAHRFGVRHHFDFHTGREVFAELCRVSEGGPADYSGLDWEALRDRGGIFWPAPRHRPEGTPRLHLDRFAHPDGRARFTPIEPTGPTVPAGGAYPLVLATGRVRDHYLSGNQTRRIPDLVRKTPGPVLEVHPQTAAAVGLVEGAHARVASRQGAVELSWAPNPHLRRDTLFVGYHWPGINDLTSDALDPTSRIAGMKHTPVALDPAGLTPAAPDTDRVCDPSEDAVAPNPA